MNVGNRTRGKHLAVPMKDKDGRDHLVVMVKYTYRVHDDGRVESDDDGPAPRPADEYRGDPATTSITRPSDLFDFKPGTDLIVLAHAHVSPSQAASRPTFVDVSVRMGPLAKVVRVHGLRTWQRGTFGGLVPGPALPIRDPLPVAYELAWGGQVNDSTGPLPLPGEPRDGAPPEGTPLAEPRNTVGRGIARDPKTLVGTPAAQIELPSHPLSERDKVPAGLGALHRHWSPRAQYAGTYDRAWRESRMPLLPKDFDHRFHVTMPHDQWSPTPLLGDEVIDLVGARPSGPVRFRLPREAPVFTSLSGGATHDHATHLDTVLVDADEGMASGGPMRVELTFRAAIPFAGKLETLERVRIAKDRR